MDRAPAALPSTDALYDSAACGLLVTSADGMIRRVNATFCGWLGRSADELVGRRRLQELLTMGGRIFHQTHWAPLMQMQGSVSEVKLELLHRDGHTVPMLLNSVRHRDGAAERDEIAAMVVVDRHQYERELLLARKNAEIALAQQREAQDALALTQARLRLALESGQLHLWDVDPGSGERRYSDSVAQLLGSGRAAAVSAEQFESSIEPADREAERAAFAQALSGANPSYHAVYRLNGIDGVQRIVSSVGKAFLDEQGRLLQFAGVLQDFTEPTRQRAEAEDRALFAEQMVGIVSHDLRNPLAAITTSAHLLGREDLTMEQVRATLGRIRSATDRAQRMIAELLDFTQARIGGGLSVTRRPVDLHALTEVCVDELAASFPEHALHHLRHGDGDCLADADRLTQLVGNLVSNAVAYGAAGRPITVSSRIEPERFVICVHNHGEPIPDAALARLFEPMVRGVDGASVGRSVGLGLFIVRQIALSHRGSVEVTSTAGAGTLFTVSCPRDRTAG